MTGEIPLETAVLQVLQDKPSDRAAGRFREIAIRIPLVAVATTMHRHELAGRDIHLEILDAFRTHLKASSAKEAFACLAYIAMSKPDVVEQDTETYWALVSRIFQQTDQAAFETAAEWTRSEHPAMRRAGIDVLGQLGLPDRSAEGRHPFAEPTQPVLNRLLSDQNQHVARAALGAASHLQTGDIDLIRQHADNPAFWVRWGVVHALSCRPEPLARETLIRLSTDEDEVIRDWATFSLGSQCEVDTPEIRAALVARLADSDGDTRAEAIKGLANRHDPRVVPEILKEIDREDTGPLIFEAAATMPDPSFLQFLEKHRDALSHDDHLMHCVEVAIVACKTGVAQPAY